MYGFAIRILCCAAQADDVVQEAFVHLWQQPERFDATRGSLRSYLIAIAHRRAVDLIRANERRRVREVSAGSTGYAGDVPGTVVDLTTTGWLAGGLSQLPARERQVLELTYFQGYTYREAATMLGLPEGTVKSRIRSALRRLRGLLDQQDA